MSPAQPNESKFCWLNVRHCRTVLPGDGIYTKFIYVHIYDDRIGMWKGLKRQSGEFLLAKFCIVLFALYYRLYFIY